MNKKPFSDAGTKYEGHIDEEFDAIVIGSGPGGYLAAEMLGKTGNKTLIVEKEFWGGVCLNIGCIPTKAMLASTHILDHITHAANYGIVGNFSDLKIDAQETWKKMHERKANVVKQISVGVKMLMKGSKCTTVDGEAKFLASHVIEVNGKIYRGKKIILAMGSHSRRLKNLPGFTENYADFTLLTSREAINFDQKLPETMTVVGGGVIGVELAQMYATAGTKVTLIQNTDSLLTGLDKDIIKEITKVFTSKGIEVIYNASCSGINANKELEFTVGDEKRTIKSEVYLLAVGRVPATEGLEKTGVELGSRNEIIVDEYQRTNVEGVYAIGDITAQAMLAHVAYEHAVTAVSHINGLDRKYYAGKPVPGCIYTSPEISFVGLTEEKAKEIGFDAFSAKYLFSRLGKGVASNETLGFAKLVVDRATGKILGGHMVGANVTDYIAEVQVAIENNLTVLDLTLATHPHPTFNEIIWECARHAAMELDAKK
ncbi:dihydrolipoyl dehydrogenase [Mycoplasmopsis opalescens]|uniref:dihydrolipoyl dehydrogenase n=1 Tax=Mycoplasmopsis opalescens TaxID=114886 RepID=UPI000562AD76|nr:dihydrolipoyl dehydrogenase [Mycoplasmopsis opalescens]